MKLVLITSFILLITNCIACDCSGSAEYSNSEMTIEWFNSHEFVFSASIDSTYEVVDEILPVQYVRLKTATIYKGDVPTLFTISPPAFRSSCSFDLSKELDKLYIVYGYIDKDGKINTHFCNGTRRLYSESELGALQGLAYQVPRWLHDLKFLEALKDLSNGQFNFKYSNGVQQANGEFLNTVPEGNWTYYNFFAKPISTGNYNLEKKQGEWIEFKYEHKVITPYVENGSVLIASGYSKGQYVGGVKEGEWKHYNEEDVHKYSSSYKDGKLQ